MPRAARNYIISRPRRDGSKEICSTLSPSHAGDVHAKPRAEFYLLPLAIANEAQSANPECENFSYYLDCLTRTTRRTNHLNRRGWKRHKGTCFNGHARGRRRFRGGMLSVSISSLWPLSLSLSLGARTECKIGRRGRTRASRGAAYTYTSYNSGNVII